MELVTGPFRPALEGAFGETFARLRARDPLAPLAVVAPSKRLSDRLKRIALEAVPEGFAAVRFFNLFSLARAIYDESPPEGFRVVLDDLVPSRLVEAVLRRHFAGEPYLGRAAIAPGAVLAALHELKAAAVLPDRALEALAAGELGAEDAPKLAEILSLHKRYSEELQRRRIHVRADIVRAAAERAPRSAFLGSLAHVLYYGFYDLDQNQVDLFREVARRVETTVFFPYADRPEYAYAKDLLESIVAPLAKARRDLPAGPPRPPAAQVAASGAHDEVWAAAKRVLEWADAGVPYGEIAVVARTLDPYADLVDSIFRDHRIPFASCAKRRLGRDPRIKAARLLFSLDDFDRAHVMDLLRSPFFRLAAGDAELWDQASRLMGIGHGADEWRRRLGARAGEDWVLQRGERAGERPFVLPAAQTAPFWEAVRALLEAPPPPERGAGWKAFSEWALDRHRRFLAPDPRVEAAVGTLADLEGLALERPVETLLEVLEGLSEPLGGPAGVQVLDAMAARGLSFRALVVLGMNERVFPRFILEDAFLKDPVRSRVEHRLGPRIPRRLRGNDEERLLFELLLGSADEVVLSHQRSDEKGRLQIPSALLPAGERGQVPRRPADRLRSRPLGLLTPREASLRTGGGEALGRAMGWDVSMLVSGAAFVEAIESRGPAGRHDGVIDARAYWNAVAAHGLSPSSLERLAECPFRYFASRMLALEDLEEPEAEEMLSPLEIGRIYHGILEQYYQYGDLESRLEEGFERFEGTRSIRYPVLWEVEKERIRRVVRALVDSDDLSFFSPAEFERELKAEIPLEVGGRKSVTFRGFVDRLDLGPENAFRVVDYKKSRGKYTVKMETGVFEKGRFLQPPLYFLLAERALGEVDVARSKFSYYFLEEVLEGGPWEMSLDGRMWARRAEFEARLRTLLETIARGEFVIRPGDYCRTCEHRTLCRKSHFPTRRRADEHATRRREEREGEMP